MIILNDKVKKGLLFLIILLPTGLFSADHLRRHTSCLGSLLTIFEADKRPLKVKSGDRVLALKLIESLQQQVLANRQNVRGKLGEVFEVNKEKQAPSKKFMQRLESLRYTLDPESRLSVDEKNGTFVMVVQGKKNILALLEDLNETTFQVNKLLHHPVYLVNKKFSRMKRMASLTLAIMMGIVAHLVDNDLGSVIFGLLASAFSPVAIIHENLSSDSYLPFLNLNTPLILEKMEKDLWHQNDWLYAGANYKLARNNAMILRLNPDITQEVPQRAIITSDLFKDHSWIVRTIAEVKDRTINPTFSMENSSVSINPNIFAGDSNIYLDSLLVNDTETKEPTLIITARILLRPPLFPKAQRQFSFSSEGLLQAKPLATH